MFLLFLTVALAASPVRLQNCRVEMQMPTADRPSLGVPLTGGVEVGFVNEARQAVTEVDFRISYAYRTETIIDRGKFSPGVRINAIFDNFMGTNFFREEPDACAIVRVKFADGSVWTS